MRVLRAWTPCYLCLLRTWTLITLSPPSSIQHKTPPCTAQVKNNKGLWLMLFKILAFLVLNAALASVNHDLPCCRGAASCCVQYLGSYSPMPDIATGALFCPLR